MGVYNASGDFHSDAARGGISLPLCSGGKPVKFHVSDSGTIPLPLQQMYPSVRTYTGVADGGITADIIIAPAGVSAQIWNEHFTKRCWIDPHTKGRNDLHTVYGDFDIEPGNPERYKPR